MFEPVFLTVAELADRWHQTPRQILDHAQALRVPLYFAFEGLAFDKNDNWLRSTGFKEWKAINEADALQQSIRRNESRLRRHARGQTDQFDALTQEDVRELRDRINVDNARLLELRASLEQRDGQRIRSEYCGYLRAMPQTLWDIATTGSAPFPVFAYHPETQINVVTLDGIDVADGMVMALEPRHGSERFRTDRITVDDLQASLSEVMAIEAVRAAKGESPVPLDADADRDQLATIGRTWSLSPPQKADPLSDMLYRALQTFSGNPSPPKVAEVVAYLAANKNETDFVRATDSGVEWYDGNGDVRHTAKTEVSRRIRRMTGQTAKR